MTNEKAGRQQQGPDRTLRIMQTMPKGSVTSAKGRDTGETFKLADIDEKVSQLYNVAMFWVLHVPDDNVRNMRSLGGPTGMENDRKTVKHFTQQLSCPTLCHLCQSFVGALPVSTLQVRNEYLHSCERLCEMLALS